MSYCRWSSDDWKSDVYVYEDCMGGWTTHVASSKRLNLDTLPPSPYEREALKRPDWQQLYMNYHMVLDALPRVSIELEHAGRTFNDPCPGDCANRLEQLRAIGYHVPQYAIDELREEQAELDKGTKP